MNADYASLEQHILGHAAYRKLISWGQPVTDFVTGDKFLGALEHYIHEVSHAFLLGIEVDEKTPLHVAEAIEALPPSEQVSQEARTWAVAWQVWQTLKLPFAWGDLVNAAEIQGVGGDDVVAHLDDGTEAVADQVVAHLIPL